MKLTRALRPGGWQTAPLIAIIATLALAPAAQANRSLLTERVLATNAEKPPPEGQIEGACGLAITADGDIYVSDYYHRVIDDYGPFEGVPAPYKSQISLPGTNPFFGTNTLDAVCGLALDAGGNLYGNEFHRRVLQITPTEATIDTGESTGLAINASSNRLFVDDRTYIAEYALPFSAEEDPLSKLAIDPSADYFGLAAFAGRLYLADAADHTVKVFEPPTFAPVATITGFHSLTDAALAVDPTNGHLLVVEDTQPLYEHPKSQVHEFGSPAEGYVNLGALPGSPIFGAPSGIAVSATGTVLVTDGNDELANVFAYGPYGVGPPAPLAPPAPTAASAAVAATAAIVQAPTTTAAPPRVHSRRKHHRRHARQYRGQKKAGGRQ